MGVTVDVKGVLRQWRQRDQDSVVITWRPAPTPGQVIDDDVAVDAVVAAVQVANRSREDEPPTSPPTSVSAWDPRMGPRGPAIFISPADSAEALSTWLTSLADELTRQGWNGRIETERELSPPLSMNPTPVLTAMLCFDGWGAKEGSRAVSTWNLDPALRDRLTDWAVDWALAGASNGAIDEAALTGDPLYFSQGPGRFAMHPDTVRQAVRRHPDKSRFSWNPDSDRMRAVSFASSGRLLIQIRDTSTPWREHVDELRRLLIHYAPDCSLGLVRHSWSVVFDAGDALDQWKPQFPRSPALDTPRSYYTFHRHLDAERVPDANGIQLLTDQHLARIHNLNRWKLTTIAPGRHLLEAPDLAPWYASNQPDPTVLAAARHDLTDAILWTQPR